MYSREIDGEEFTFGVSGKLIRNVLVMYDRQTGTLWSQLLGVAVEGPLEGTELEYVASRQTTWEDWKSKHPDTLALKKGYFGQFDPYDSYYGSASAGVIGRAETDNRLFTKEFVIGVDHQGEAVAFPFSVLNDEPVVNHEVGDVPVLVVFDKGTGSGVVFNREVNGETLTFQKEDGFTLKDEETGTLWDGQTGKAIGGSLEGESLSPVKSTSSFWFGWRDLFPHTEIYGLES